MSHVVAISENGLVKSYKKKSKVHHHWCQRFGAVLRKVQKEIKWQADKRKKKVEEWKKSNKVILSIKNLVFKEKPVRKLVDQYISPYIIGKVVSTNVIKL